ncbi:hypothetical protein AB0K51_13890 [Kitasatospora sp. NPDC049285]|uniref:hypothetical protein n=1 Tax=Kitasatospora sp. NPDC049285 TaxID=3157096 RepID=UPI00344514CF
MTGTRLVTAAAGVAVAALVAGCGTGSDGWAKGPTPSHSSAAVSASAAAASQGAATAGDNGVAQLPAADIVQRASQALRDAHAVRAAGTVEALGQTITLDLRLDTAGNCNGSLGLGGEGGFKLVKAGQQLWVKPDRVFWDAHGGAGIADLVGDRYLKTTVDDPDFGELGSLCDLGALADQLGSDTASLTTGAATTLRGLPAVPVSGSSDGEPGTLYVATAGAPVPLRLEKSAGAVDFTDFGTPVPSATPGPNETVDLNELTPGSSPSTV